MPTIGDELSAKGVSWAWYAGGWNNAVAGNPDPLFQYHHQAFNYFKNYASGRARTEHLKDEQDFVNALKRGSVPQVSFIKPLGPDNEHPGYTNISQGEQHAADLIHAIQQSPIWRDTVVVVTYDEHGGSWDHAPPPTPATDGARADRWGPGIRVPAIIISPFARTQYVDHTEYDTTSILKLIEERFGVAAHDLTNALTLGPGPAAGMPATGSGGTLGLPHRWQAIFLLLALGLFGLGGISLTLSRIVKR